MAMIVKSQRRVSPQALPSARVQAPSGGTGIVPAAIGQFGRQISQLGGRMQQVEQAETLQAAKVKAQTAKDQAIFKDRQDKLWADQQTIKFQDYWRDKGSEFTALKGTNAVGSTDAASKDMEKFKTSILDSAKNNEQRALFESSFAVKREVSLNKQKSHEVQQFRNAEISTTDAKISNAMREAADNPNDELTFYSAATDLREGIDVKTRGMSRDQKNNVTAEYISSFYEGVLNTKVSVNAEDAKVFYEKNKKNILPENRPAIEKTLKVEDTLQFAQKKTDELILTYPDDHTKQLEAAREIEDADKRKATVDLTKTRKKELDQHKKEVDHEVYLDAMRGVQDAANLEAAKEIALRHDDPTEQDKLLAVAHNRHDKKTVANTTDRGVQADVYEKIDNNIIKVHADLIEYSPYLSDGDYNKALSRIDNRNKAIKGVDTGSVSMSDAKAAYSLIKGSAFDIDEDSKEFMYVQEGLEIYKKGLGRKPTPVELNRETAKLLVEGEDIGGGFFGGDPNQTLMEAIEEGTEDTWLPNIYDEKERREITEAFKANGIITEDEDLLRLYKKQNISKRSLSQKEISLLNSLIMKSRRNR